MDEVLAQSGLFQGLSDEAVEPVVSRLEMLTLPRGRVVFNEGEPGDSLYIVIGGQDQAVPPRPRRPRERARRHGPLRPVR